LEGDRRRIPIPQNRSFDIVGVGRNSWDRIALVPSYPLPDRKVEVLDFDIQPGGQVATALVSAARLGTRSRYLGKFGDDAGGRAVRGALSREGIDLSESRVIPGVPNQSAFIVVDRRKKTRNVFSHVDPRLRLSPDDFTHEAVTAGRLLYLGGRNPTEMIPFARMGREAGCLVAVDADSTDDGVGDLLAAAHIVICPESFALELTGEKSLKRALRNVQKRGPSLVCATRGENGASMLLDGAHFEDGGFPANVVDTTGAGDVFHGALLVGLLERMDPPLLLRFANAAAAMKCRHLGGQRGIPGRAEVEAFLDRDVGLKKL
jgi:sugar/nucleoside kinase (ribokinase family)